MAQQTWRELLGRIVVDPQARAELATMLGVSAVTLTRWANGETHPRAQNLRALLKFLPAEYRDQMVELLAQEYPEYLNDIQTIRESDGPEKIPSDFYASVLVAVIGTRKEQIFFTVGNRILTQMLGQLDPNNLGMAVSIAQCMPPAPGQKVRSLREVFGRGTPPWQSTLVQEALFLGAESLAGYALMKGRTITAASKADRLGFYTVRWETWEESAVACPIMREGRFAGCLIASSTQAGYFVSFRQTLVERYAQLLLLAFEPEHFYNHEDIQLLPMPDVEVQLASTANFKQRLSTTILEASRAGRTASIEQVERSIWQQLEEELLSMVVYGSGSDIPLLPK
jgi:transcriptional regulator with XRE-family HTH domain